VVARVVGLFLLISSLTAACSSHGPAPGAGKGGSSGGAGSQAGATGQAGTTGQAGATGAAGTGGSVAGAGGAGTGGAPECKLGGEACDASDQCCSLDCSQLKCAACRTEGQPCAFGVRCCGALGLGCADFNLVLEAGVCRACKRVPAGCARDSDCCSGICNQGLCGGCRDIRSLCSTGWTCCPSTAYPTSCQFIPSVESTECCVVTGGNCRDDADCCGRACRNGRCCSGFGEVCSTVADCCTDDPRNRACTFSGTVSSMPFSLCGS
jgi:hypothetical protein